MKKLLLLPLLAIFNHLPAQVTVRVRLDTGFIGPYSGHLFVYTLNDTSATFNDQTMQSEPAFRIPVRNWSGKQVQTVDKDATWFMKPIDSLVSGYYKLIAILDTNTMERGNSAPGNLYTRNEGILYVDEHGRGTGTLLLNSQFRARQFRSSELVKEVKLPSAVLSRFRGIPVHMMAAVVLPASYYRDTARRYPVVYIIPGWGGTHYHGAIEGNQRIYGMGQGKDKIYVYLNPETQTPYGLHAFVDSRINGPWGTALVEEMLPYIRDHYRGTTDAEQTFLTGQSSGGYGVLWLALHYPQHFGGCWATSPDPVDFSSFTGVNLYRDKNYYKDEKGNERGFYAIDGAYKTTIRKASEMELFAGDGGQQQSFEAEFGMPGKDGRPQHLFDPASGAIHKKIVEQWKPYDLALYILHNRERISRFAAGKINIYVGEHDNFRLNESAKALAAKTTAVKVVEIPGANHFTVRDSVLTKKIQAEMDARIKE